MEAWNLQLRKQQSEFRVPPVMVYVREKTLHGALESTIKTWERKVEIAEVSPAGPRTGRLPCPSSFSLGFCFAV